MDRRVNPVRVSRETKRTGASVCGRPGLLSVLEWEFVLDVEQEIDDVAGLDDVGLALAAERPEPLGFGHRAGGDHVVVADDLGTDEPALDVAVNGTGRFDGGLAPADRPGAALI